LGKGAVTGLLGAAGGAVGGFIAGKAMSVLGPMAMSLGGRMLGGALAGGIGDAATQLASGQPVDLGSVALSAGIGAAFGGFYKGGAGGKGGKSGKGGNEERTAERDTDAQGPTGCRGKNSFAADTQVVMADGSTKPIKDITIGDKVKATDPATGKTDAKPVTKLYLNRDLTNVAVVTAGTAKTATAVGTDSGTKATTSAGKKILAGAAAAMVLTGGAVLATTQHHPFWDQTTKTWTDATDLQPGVSTLISPDGAVQTVAAVDNFTGAQNMYNLTVADTHTYYVLAGNTPVLVHNCGGGPINTSTEGIEHTLQRHFSTGEQSAGKSLFDDSEMPHQLATQAEGTPLRLPANQWPNAARRS
jgi:hypothetical protein